MTLIIFVPLILMIEPIYVRFLMRIVIYVIIIKLGSIIIPHESSMRMLENYTM